MISETSSMTSKPPPKPHPNTTASNPEMVLSSFALHIRESVPSAVSSSGISITSLNFEASGIEIDFGTAAVTSPAPHLIAAVAAK